MTITEPRGTFEESGDRSTNDVLALRQRVYAELQTIVNRDSLRNAAGEALNRLKAITARFQLGTPDEADLTLLHRDPAHQGELTRAQEGAMYSRWLTERRFSHPETRLINRWWGITPPRSAKG